MKKTPGYMDDQEDVLVIGIDFGTTFSGVAFATIEEFENNQIQLITGWPGTGREEGKAPTELYYEDDQVYWGYEIPTDADPVKWFKLLLLKDEDLAPELRTSDFLVRARKMLREEDKSPTDFIADYLRLLWNYTLEKIESDRGSSVVDALKFHVVLTVPAIWKPYARQGMEDAARQAGILKARPAGPTTLSFAPEPEAAALSTLCEPGRRTNAGDVYIICDAGGGTVDLSTYRIEDNNPIQMAEAVEGTGGLCGGIFVDEAFERICKARLGRQWDRLSRAGVKDIMKGEWEKAIKPQFRNPQNNSKEYIVGIPAEAFKKAKLDDTTKEPLIKDGRIHFKSHHIQKAFTSCFNDINQLIVGQINKAKSLGTKVSGIILVGGLGSSPYLHEYLKGIHSANRIDILQSGGIRPRTAICRGAVYKGFLDGLDKFHRGDGIEAPISITSAISRASYGIGYYEMFDSSKHSAIQKTWSENEKNWIADGKMRWYLKKGENVSKKDPIKYNFYYLYSEDPGSKFMVNMRQCEDDVPPSQAGPTVADSCTITWTMLTPFALLPDYTNSAGEILKKLEFDLEMIPSGASIEFAVFIDGKRQGGSNTSVRF